MQRHFVALAADADDMEDEVALLAQNLENASTLPFVIFADSDGRFLAGSSGSVDPRAFAATLKKLAAV